MEVNFILIPVEGSFKEDFVDRLIENEFSDKTKNSFGYINNSGESVYIDYKLVKRLEEKVFYFNISYGIASNEVAKILSEVSTKIKTYANDNKYGCILAYDSISKYHCEKMYSYLSKFERLIRKLVLNVATYEYGHNWHTEFLQESDRDKLKKRIQAKGSKTKRQIVVVEEYLNSIELGHLNSLLFDSMHCNNESKTYSDEELNNKNKKELIEIINNLKPKSLWDMLFEQHTVMKGSEIRCRFKAIQGYRNIVAHSKQFWIDDYEKCIKIIANLNNELKEANEILESQILGSGITLLTPELSEAFKSTLEGMVEVLKEVDVFDYSQILNKIALPDMSITMSAWLKVLKDNDFFDNPEILKGRGIPLYTGLIQELEEDN